VQIAEGRTRFIESSDLDRVLTWRNSECIRQNMFSNHLISREEHQHWFKSLNKGQRIGLIFELNQRPVGVVNIADIDKVNQKCSWGFYLSETDLPAGTGLLMGYHGLQFIFETLAIRKLYSQVLAFNHSSIKYHEKLGFRHEGRLIKDRKKNDEYQDIVLFALFQDQWPAERERIEKFLTAD